ncbi:hypothetical protein [Mesorhizobium sp. M7A.F.Ca.US.001.04.2.1]|uniref:hypothetical protein n=1 Tax=unclassified Mesorhizobium TaxID=325217 RepID=UPI0032AF9470
MGLEGMVSKRPDSVYRSGDTEAWLKTKCYEEVDFEVAGVQLKPGSAPLALMATRDAERRYVGSANIALTKAMRERLWAKVQEGKGTPKGADKPDNEWIKPGLVGCVKALKREDKLRHATLRSARRNYDTAAGIAPCGNRTHWRTRSLEARPNGHRAGLPSRRAAIRGMVDGATMAQSRSMKARHWPRRSLRPWSA